MPWAWCLAKYKVNQQGCVKGTFTTRAPKCHCSHCREKTRVLSIVEQKRVRELPTGQSKEHKHTDETAVISMSLGLLFSFLRVVCAPKSSSAV
jgi:hypothetical protein